MFVNASKQNLIALCLNSKKFSARSLLSYSLFSRSLVGFPLFSYRILPAPSSDKIVESRISITALVLSLLTSYSSPHRTFGSSVIYSIAEASKYLIGASVYLIITFSIQLTRLLSVSFRSSLCSFDSTFTTLKCMILCKIIWRFLSERRPG